MIREKKLTVTIGNVPINVMVLTVVALLNNTQACVFVIHYISGVILISGAIPLDYRFGRTDLQIRKTK